MLCTNVADYIVHNASNTFTNILHAHGSSGKLLMRVQAPGKKFSRVESGNKTSKKQQ